MDPVQFVRDLAPFRELPQAAFEAVAEGLEITYVPAGTVVLRKGGEPSRYLLILRKGTVALQRDGTVAMTLEPGDWFGFLSLLENAPPEFDTVAEDDLLLYRIPGDVVRKLVRFPSVAAHISGGLAARLRAVSASPQEPGSEVGDLTAPVRDLIDRPPVLVASDCSVGGAARTMREEGVSSVLVCSEPAGILTDRDLRNKVLAEGHGPAVPCTDVCSSPVRGVSGDTPVFEAMVTMLDGGTHHLAITDRGTPSTVDDIVGLVTTGDLLRHRAHSPLHLQRRMARATRAEQLTDVTDQVPGVIRGLWQGGLGALEVARAVTALSDTLTRAAVRVAQTELGPAPAPFAWLALGSQGRREQTLLTDQDTALVYADDSDEDARRHFVALAERATALMVAAGVPPCPGDTMAPSWHGTVTQWRERFAGWVSEPDVRALMEASIFFDFRRVTGDLDVSVLDDVLLAARRDAVFLSRLAATAMTSRPPVGLFKRLREDEAGTIDLKAGGIVPLVDLGRLLALEAGALVRPTIERLEAAAAEGVLSVDGADTLMAAFAFLQQVRLDRQLEALAAGQPATNHLAPDTLPTTSRRHLKEILVAIADIQDATSQRHGAHFVFR